MLRLSLPLCRLLYAASISPMRLNAAMDERCEHHWGPMRYDDAIPRKLMKASGVEVDLIRRRNRTLLFEINDHRFIYRERSKRDCIVIIPMTVPDTVQNAAAGEVIESQVHLEGAASILRGSKIVGATDSWQGSVAFSLQPEWVEIDV